LSQNQAMIDDLSILDDIAKYCPLSHCHWIQESSPARQEMILMLKQGCDSSITCSGPWWGRRKTPTPCIWCHWITSVVAWKDRFTFREYERMVVQQHRILHHHMN
jgi:hypothetical protein